MCSATQHVISTKQRIALRSGETLNSAYGHAFIGVFLEKCIALFSSVENYFRVARGAPRTQTLSDW